MVHQPGRVSIIGAGTLGATIAYSLIMGNHAKEILLVDRSNKIVQGQVLDLMEASEGTDTVVRAGTFKEAGQSTLVIITADTPIYPNEDRVEWLIRNRKLSNSIAESMSLLHSDIFILVASNPVDLYVQSFQQYFSDVPTNRIFGIGTTMATIRFNTWLAQMSNLKQATVSGAYCIGNQVHPVIVWNHAKVNDTAISTIPSLVSHRSSLETLVSGHRHKLICERKGQAWYGLSAIITRLCAELLSNNRKGKGKVEEKEEKTWVLSTYVPHYDTCISWPVKLNCDGIYKLIDVPLTPSEFAQMMAVVKCNILDFDKSS